MFGFLHRQKNDWQVIGSAKDYPESGTTVIAIVENTRNHEQSSDPVHVLECVYRTPPKIMDCNFEAWRVLSLKGYKSEHIKPQSGLPNYYSVKAWRYSEQQKKKFKDQSIYFK